MGVAQTEGLLSRTNVLLHRFIKILFLLSFQIWELWSQLKPFLVQFAMYVSEVLSLALDWIKKYGPIYGQLALDTIYHTVVTVGQTVDGWING